MRLLRRLDGAVNPVKHCRVQRAEPLGDLIVPAINRECVLDQIVCAQLKKVYFTRDLLGRQHSRRNFDHCPYLHGGKCDVLAREALNLLLNHTLCKSNITNIRDHRNHKTERSRSSRTQNRTNLRAHDRLVTQIKTDRAQTERGVALALLQVRPKFSTNIKQSDNRAVFTGCLDESFVDLVLLVLRAHHSRARQEKFGTKQAHAARSKITHRLKLRR